MMFQNLAKNTCTGMKFKAICYEWQYACELKEILWHWEIRMHEVLKEQPVLKMKWCSVASSTTWQRNVCQRNDVEATIMLYMYLHIALLSPVIVYFPGLSTGLWHITTCPCIYLFIYVFIYCTQMKSTTTNLSYQYWKQQLFCHQHNVFVCTYTLYKGQIAAIVKCTGNI